MSQSLPQWALDGLREAGLSEEGWNGRERSCLFTVAHQGMVWVDEHGAVTCESDQPNVSFAFQVASRLAAALENKPCPKCAELEAQLGDAINAPTDYDFGFDQGWCGAWDFQEKELDALREENKRLRGVVESTHVEGIGRWIDRSMLDLPISHAKPLTQEDFDRDAEMDRLACEVSESPAAPTEQETQENDVHSP